MRAPSLHGLPAAPSHRGHAAPAPRNHLAEAPGLHDSPSLQRHARLPGFRQQRIGYDGDVVITHSAQSERSAGGLEIDDALVAPAGDRASLEHEPRIRRVSLEHRVELFRELLETGSIVEA